MVLQKRGINLQDLLLGKHKSLIGKSVVTATHFIEGN